MPWRWCLGWMAVWELIGLGAVLTLLWTLLGGSERGRHRPPETNGIS
jgi:hypothetical protein